MISVSTFRYVAEHARAAVAPLAKEREVVQARRDEALAALEGGFRGNGTREDIERNYRTTLSDVNGRIRDICDDARAKLEKSITSSFAIDAETAARLDPVFRDCRLTDFDLQNLVRSNPNYTALKMAANIEGSDFAKSVRVRLKAHQDAAADAIDRLVRVVRDTDSGSLAAVLRGDDADAVLTSLDAENASFDAFIAGEEEAPTAPGLLGVIARMEA